MAAKLDFDPHGVEWTRIIDAWLPLTYAMNSINRSMGMQDLYPFVLTPAVIVKTLLRPPAHACASGMAPGKRAATRFARIAAGLRRRIGAAQMNPASRDRAGDGRRFQIVAGLIHESAPSGAARKLHDKQAGLALQLAA